MVRFSSRTQLRHDKVQRTGEYAHQQRSRGIFRVDRSAPEKHAPKQEWGRIHRNPQSSAVLRSLNGSRQETRQRKVSRLPKVAVRKLPGADRWAPRLLPSCPLRLRRISHNGGVKVLLYARQDEPVCLYGGVVIELSPKDMEGSG